MTESERFPSHTTAMTDLHLHRCAGVGFLLLGILAADPTAGQAASLLRWSSVPETLRHSLHWRPLDLAGVATKVPLAPRFPEEGKGLRHTTHYLGSLQRNGKHFRSRIQETQSGQRHTQKDQPSQKQIQGESAQQKQKHHTPTHHHTHTTFTLPKRSNLDTLPSSWGWGPQEKPKHNLLL